MSFPISRIAALAAPLLLAGLGGCAAMGERHAAMHAQHHGAYSFGLWGDMPYKKAGDDSKLPAVLASINASDIAFSIYDGDIKDGSSRCDNTIYDDALKMFGSMKQPVVYIPGDNEWTDCHRTNNGGFDALERLAHLRRVMYPTLASLGQATMPLEHQGKAAGDKFIENVRFTRGPVTFVGLNVPGSNNNVVMNAKECTGKSARKAANCDAANAEYLERDAANIAWLDASFKAAKAAGSRGVVVVIQGDPGFDLPETEDLDESQAPGVSGYRNFMAEVSRQTTAFDGEVLFVHGDTHAFKVDKPLHAPNNMMTNFTRVETFGSPSLHWVKVTVTPGAASLFRIEPVIVSQKK
ncbi:hypothetical protein [Leptothrix discophora]|uniref:Calcineurin-like phosphoesterase domain-containing protein n=1 Tax=Leptothrix discophora TaxID=89 RepID=A0ABT9G917_LEPDI|nr:hypothetical protein [Leptothrix discophora]MDP4302965.1 hypothetical protein [Leptothrix discophora]